ncbi:MAG TPA: CBS domain-containing protein [Anaerolineales bacterium]
MYTVKQLLQMKKPGIWSTSPDATVYDALKLMADQDVGALLVIENNRLVGIFSERDYARKVILHGKTSNETLVSEIMTDRVVYVKPSQTTEECMAIMTEKHIRHLPVLEGDQILGVISIGDVVKALLSKQEFVIAQLEQYITGQR